MKNQRIIAAFAVFTGLALAFLPQIVPICGLDSTGKLMRCFFTYRVELILGLLTAITAASLFVLTERQGKILAGIMLTLLAIIVIILPQSWLSGICRHPHAACHGTYLGTVAGGVILATLGLFTAWSNFSTSEAEKQK